MCSV